jgi:hypothetical protein
MVDHGDHGHPHGSNAEQAPTQALVVEDDVETVASLDLRPAQHQAQPERLHFRKHPEARDAQFPKAQRLEE